MKIYQARKMHLSKSESFNFIINTGNFLIEHPLQVFKKYYWDLSPLKLLTKALMRWDFLNKTSFTFIADS